MTRLALLLCLLCGCCPSRLGLEPVPLPRPVGECVQCRYRPAERGVVCDKCREVYELGNRRMYGW